MVEHRRNLRKNSMKRSTPPEEVQKFLTPPKESIQYFVIVEQEVFCQVPSFIRHCSLHFLSTMFGPPKAAPILFLLSPEVCIIYTRGEGGLWPPHP